ncbi:MAG: hypothetical protein ACREJD_05335 [Phycisphaerales bacterium]
MSTQIWIWWISGVVLGGIAAFVVAWAVLSDRLAGNRVKRRCPSCWYDMTSVVGRKCPECGREARAEVKLFRSRRRWGWASVGLLAIVCAFALNWYAAGRVLGWMRVMPLWMQVRLVPIIPANDILMQNSWYNAKPVSLDSGTAARLQEIALDEIARTGGNPNLASSAAQPAAYALAAMKDQITDRERVAKVLLRAACGNPGSMHHCAGKLASELLGQEAYFVETGKMLQQSPPANRTAARQSIIPFVLMELKPPYTDQIAIAVADIVTADPEPFSSYPAIAALIQEHPGPFFRRMLEQFQSGDKARRASVLWVMRANVRSPVGGDPSYLSISREACAMLASPDEKYRDQATSLIVHFFPDVIMPVLPEIAALLSADIEWTRRYARTTLVNVKVTRDQDENALVDAVCETLRTGRDRGRALAVEILSIRRQSLRPGVDAALLDAIERTDDVELADRLIVQYSSVASTRFLFPATFGPRSDADWEKLEARLLRMLDRGGAHTAVACKWLARLPTANDATLAKLRRISTDAGRDASDRAAARDALLHVRDRSNPTVDVLEALK